MLLQDFINRHPDSLCSVNCSTAGISLTGILSDPYLTQGLSAEYGQGFKGLIGSLGGAMSSTGQGMQNANLAAGKKGGMAGGALDLGGQLMSRVGGYATSKHTLLGTVKVYEGSSDISLPISMLVFPDIMGNGGTKSIDLQINKCTQPKILTGDILTSYFYDMSELEKIPTGNGSLNFFKGKLPTVALGEWFLAPDVYITNVGKGTSTILDEDGKPIAINWNFQITPYRQLSAEELSDWVRI
jgi:hypothetical protein